MKRIEIFPFHSFSVEMICLCIIPFLLINFVLAKPNYTPGIDVSHHNGIINWINVKNAGKKFVFIKATESTTFVDNRFSSNFDGAIANGLYAGAYHFARPDKSSATIQVNHFLKVVVPKNLAQKL